MGFVKKKGSKLYDWLDHIYTLCLYILQTAENMSRPSERDPEKEWLEKLFGECEDEFCETFGVYDGKFKLFLMLNSIFTFNL